MPINVKWDEAYAPAEATRGSWVPLDMSTVSAYPVSAGRGRYAQLVYDVGGAGSLAGGTVSAIIIEPVTINGVISADIIEVENIWFTTPLSSHITQIDLANTTINNSRVINVGASSVVVFAHNIEFMEIYNKNTKVNNVIQLSYNVGDTYNNVVAWGLPIEPESYYSVQRSISAVVLVNNSANPVSAIILGHYRA